MSLWSDVHQIALEHPEGDPVPIARRFLSTLGEEQLVTLVADAILTARRHHVHRAEDDAFVPLPPEEVVIEGFERVTAAVAKKAQLAREQFLELLDKTFAVGDRKGTVVRWGEATVAQHQSRITLLEKQVQGTLVTISRHQQAIAIIEAEQVTCLNEAIQPSEPGPARHAGGEALAS